MNIEEIMKPYFEKKEEIENKLKINDELINKKQLLNLRLERLRNNKEREIAEYIQNEILRNSSFVGAEAIKKDLEKAYSDKEKQIENDIKLIEEEIETNLFESRKYYNVEVREISDIKFEVRKDLLSAKKELELKVEENKIRHDIVKLGFSKFKYQYDENHSVINGDELRNLFEESNSLVSVLYNLKNQLKQIDEYLTLIEPTNEEIRVSMLSMNAFEKEEYNRRKMLKNSEFIEPVIEEENVEELEFIEPIIEEENAEEPEFIEPIIEEENVEEPEFIEPIIEEENVEEPEFIEPIIEEEKAEESEITPITTGTEEELLKDMFIDILKSAKQLRTVRLLGEEGNYSLDVKGKISNEVVNIDKTELEEEQQIKLPNGVYLHERDIKNALNNYVNQNKGKILKVDATNTTLEIDKKMIKGIKSKLRDCSIIKLLKEKKLSFFDIKKVYGKQKAQEYNEKVEMGTVETKVSSGNYINLDEFAQSLKSVFEEKGQCWLDRIKERYSNIKNLYWKDDTVEENEVDLEIENSEELEVRRK